MLGLCALAMGVMAISTAGVAQAETGACWGYMNGAELKCFNASLEAKPLLAVESNTATLLIANTNLEILCKTAALVEGGQLGPEGSVLLGKVLFGGCIGLSVTPELKQLVNCTPTDPVDGAGTVITEKLKG